MVWPLWKAGWDWWVVGGGLWEAGLLLCKLKAVVCGAGELGGGALEAMYIIMWSGGCVRASSGSSRN